MAAGISGGCRCGNVRYQGERAPMFAAHCHCRDCQYSSGGAYATVFAVPADSLSMQGELTAYTVQAESGNDVTREFCPTCGSPVLSKLAANPGITILKGATLDDPATLAPQMHIWTGSGQPWAETSGQLPSFEKNPG